MIWHIAYVLTGFAAMATLGAIILLHVWALDDRALQTKGRTVVKHILGWFYGIFFGIIFIGLFWFLGASILGHI